MRHAMDPTQARLQTYKRRDRRAAQNAQACCACMDAAGGRMRHAHARQQALPCRSHAPRQCRGGRAARAAVAAAARTTAAAGGRKKILESFWPNRLSRMSSPVEPGPSPSHLLHADHVEQRLHAVVVDQVVWTSALSRLSTRRDHAVSKRGFGRARPSCSCHSATQPSRPGASRMVERTRSESHSSWPEQPTAAQGQMVMG